MKQSLLASSLVTLALAGSAFAGSQIFNGNYLRVGVNDSGGLIDSGFQVGISYDKTGTGTFPIYDFLKPGTPYEFGAVGYNGSGTHFGYYDGNTIGGSTTNTSVGSTFSAKTTGKYGSLNIEQDLSYAKSGGTIYFSVKLTNSSDTALERVIYARGLDPDQDVYAGGGYPTTNAIIGTDLVTGTAPTTDWTIGIYSNSKYAHTPTINASWPNTYYTSNPYNLLTPRNDGYGDWSINMAWNIGTLGAGQSAVVNFEYRIAETKGEVVDPVDPNRVPDAASTLGLLAGAFGLLVAFKRRQA